MKNEETALLKTGKSMSLSERFGTDINFARFQVFASKEVRGYRTLPALVDEVDGVQITRTVSVGTYKGTGETLNADDELVFKAIYARWEKNGCKMEDRTIMSALMNTANSMLLRGPNDKKRARMGERDYQRLRRSLDKLARIPIEFDNAYEHNMGYSTETIQILEKAEVFNRKENWGDHGEKGGKFFEFTKLELNKKICQNIKDGKIKLFYLDQQIAIRGETGRLIYGRLELLGGVIKSPFRREALAFARECTIDIGPHGKVLGTKEIIRKLRRAAEELKGKLLTCGIVGKCAVEFENGKWFFVCHINKVVTAHPKVSKKGKPPSVPSRTDLEIAAERQKDADLLARYDQLSEKTRAAIDRRTKEIYAEKYKMGSDRYAKLEAISERLSLGYLHEDVEEIKRSPLVAREPASSDYLPDAAVILRRFLRSIPLQLEYKPVLIS